jgi:hypothetical protein
LIVGPPFTGKTWSLWTLAKYLRDKKLGKLHHFDLDFKAESLITAIQKNDPSLLDHVVIHRLGVNKTIQAAGGRIERSRDEYDDFRNDYNKFWPMVDGKTGQWKSDVEAPGAIIVDSLTAFGDIVMAAVLAEVGHDLNAPKTDARDDYGRQMGNIKKVIVNLKSLPCITGWIAHDQLIQYGAQGQMMSLPAITGKLAGQLAAMFNYVLYSTVQTINDKKVYNWQVQPDGFVRSAGVTSKFDLPTFVPQDFVKIFS